MRLWPVAQGVAWRTLKLVLTNPSILVPSLIFPLFFFLAFAGGLSQVAEVPGFDYPPGYTTFQFCFVLVQSAAFGGVFTGFGIARDFERGIGRRLLLAAPNRTGIVLGYTLAAAVRWLITAFVLTVVALVAGMNVFGGTLDVFGMYGLALLINMAGVLWAAGVAMRFRTMQAGPGDADARLPAPLLRARVRPARLARRLDRGGRDAQPGHVRARGRAQHDGGRRGARGLRVRDRASASWRFFALWSLRGLRKAEAAGYAPVGYRRAVSITTAPRLGASPLEPGTVELRTWAPAASEVAVRLGDGDHPLSRGRRRRLGGRVPASPGDDYRFVLDGDAWPDPCSRRQPEGVRGPVAHRRHGRLRDRARAGARARRARSLRAPRGHVLAGGDLRRRRPAPRRPARARGHRDRADARRDGARQPGLGVRRPLHVGSARGLRRPGRPGPARRRGAPRGSRRRARRRLQPRRPRERGPARLRALLHRPFRRDAVGPGARLRAGRRARVGDPERRALGARVRDRRAAPRRGPRGPGRLGNACPRRAGRARCAPRTRARS